MGRAAWLFARDQPILRNGGVHEVHQDNCPLRAGRARRHRRHRDGRIADHLGEHQGRHDQGARPFAGAAGEDQQGRHARAAGATGVAGANGTTGAAGASGQAGANGLDGTNGVDGANGLAGTNGVDGTNGLNGTNGVDGKDGVRYDRLTGTCTTGLPGEVAIAGGAARLGLPEDMSWAQIRAYPHDLELKDVKRLSFSSNASDRGVVYMKITTTGHNSVVFSPNTQGVDEQGVGKLGHA